MVASIHECFPVVADLFEWAHAALGGGVAATAN
jgi:hypothetical protein